MGKRNWGRARIASKVSNLNQKKNLNVTKNILKVYNIIMNL